LNRVYRNNFVSVSGIGINRVSENRSKYTLYIEKNITNFHSFKLVAIHYNDAFKVKCANDQAYLESVVVGARHDPVAAELKTGDDVIVVTLENPRGANRKNPPVHFDVVLTHVAGLKRIFKSRL